MPKEVTQKQRAGPYLKPGVKSCFGRSRSLSPKPPSKQESGLSSGRLNETPPQPDGRQHSAGTHAPSAQRNLFRVTQDTPVTDVPGFRKKLGETLQKKGHETVGDLQKQMKKGFMDWLQEVCGAESDEQECMYNVVMDVIQDDKGASGERRHSIV